MEGRTAPAARARGPASRVRARHVNTGPRGPAREGGGRLATPELSALEPPRTEVRTNPARARRAARRARAVS